MCWFSGFSVFNKFCNHTFLGRVFPLSVSPTFRFCVGLEVACRLRSLPLGGKPWKPALLNLSGPVCPYENSFQTFHTDKFEDVARLDGIGSQIGEVPGTVSYLFVFSRTAAAASLPGTIGVPRSTPQMKTWNSHTR